MLRLSIPFSLIVLVLSPSTETILAADYSCRQVYTAYDTFVDAMVKYDAAIESGDRTQVKSLWKKVLSLSFQPKGAIDIGRDNSECDSSVSYIRNKAWAMWAVLADGNGYYPRDKSSLDLDLLWLFQFVADPGRDFKISDDDRESMKRYYLRLRRYFSYERITPDARLTGEIEKALGLI
jgi:hypothetical protein